MQRRDPGREGREGSWKTQSQELKPKKCSELHVVQGFRKKVHRLRQEDCSFEASVGYRERHLVSTKQNGLGRWLSL